MRRLLVLPLLLVAGCTHDLDIPPADRLVCPDEPAIPSAPVTDSKNSTYLRGMRGAWAGCREDVDWMRAWFAARKN